MARKILITNGQVLDPSQGMNGAADLLINGDRIEEIVPRGKKKASAANDTLVIDASGKLVLPGLVDLHTHLREPGFEYKETIATGTRAAIRGGFTSVCCMPNTNPVNDNPTVTAFIMKKAAEEGACAVFPIGAITKGQQGQELAEVGFMREGGCVAFSDDGRPVMSSLIMRRILEYAHVFNAPVIAHCEDISLSEGGVMNEGETSAFFGLRGISSAAEEIMIARDLILAKRTRGTLHIAHVSTKGAVELIRRAKADGISVTAETCPHYFSITDKAVAGFNTNARVNPPLRTEEDVAAIKQGLRDGTIDVIATDHAPHHHDERLLEFDKAPCGISGLETALGLSLALVKEGVLTMSQLVEKMALAPSRIIGVDRGTLKKGAPADVVIVDPTTSWTVDPARFVSKGKNTPFGGFTLTGKAVITISSGTVHDSGV